jgi:hypothetical protein
MTHLGNSGLLLLVVLLLAVAHARATRKAHDLPTFNPPTTTMAARGSKKAMKVKAEPLGDTSPIARKHTPPQGKGKKVAVKATKGKEMDVIGTSGHAPMPGRQPRQVKSRYARSQVKQQGQPGELRQQLKRTRKDQPLLSEAESAEIQKRILKNPPKLIGMDEGEDQGLFDPYVQSSEEPVIGTPPGGADAEGTESEAEKSWAVPSPLRSPDRPAQMTKVEPASATNSPQPLSVASREGDDVDQRRYLLRAE